MKYEIKSTARMFLPFYLIVVGLAVIARIFQEISRMLAYSYINHDLIYTTLNAIYVISMMFFVMGFIVVCLLTPIISVYRFRTNLLKSEGYLMMTLPVKPSQHIWAKLHTMFLWGIGTLITCGIALLILLVNSDFLRELLETIASLPQEYFQMTILNRTTVTIFILQLLICAMMTMYQSVMIYYSCLAVGHRFTNKYPVLGAIVVYLIFQFVLSIISTILIVMFSFFIDSTNLNRSIDPGALINIIMLLVNLFIAGIFTAGYFVTKNILSKHLNLE